MQTGIFAWRPDGDVEHIVDMPDGSDLVVRATAAGFLVCYGVTCLTVDRAFRIETAPRPTSGAPLGIIDLGGLRAMR